MQHWQHRLRRFHFMLSTLLGNKRGFFIPYRYAAQTEPPALYPHLESLFQTSETRFEQLIKQISVNTPTFLSWQGHPPPTPRWDQGWYSGLDAASLYTIIQIHKPKRYIEIGSGHSTRFAAQAIQDSKLPTQMICIDPAPRRKIDTLNITWHSHILQETPLEVFQSLEGGDILMIDSSHIMMPGTDLDDLATRILPTLKPGVLLHFHDIFLPYEYPQNWRWRAYNEQNWLATLIKPSTLMWSSAYVRKALSQQLSEAGLNKLPDNYPHLNSALWLKWSA